MPRANWEVKFPLVEDGSGTQAVHDVVVAYQAAQRMGTACTKTMGEVAGSGKKPWRQKGTGRARAGSFASPLWRGGGVVFGPKPRDFTKKSLAQHQQLALRKALSERLRAGDVVLVDDFKLGSAKTKEFVGVSDALELERHRADCVAGGGQEPDAGLAQRARRGADDERCAKYLRSAALGQAGFHPGRFRASSKPA